MTNADLSGATLTNASFYTYETVITGAILTGANIHGATFDYPVGFTTAQLNSTASYQAHDLTETWLASNNLVGVNLVSQNLAKSRAWREI